MNIWVIGLHWFRFVACLHSAITDTNADLSSIEYIGEQNSVKLHQNLIVSTHEMHLNMFLYMVIARPLLMPAATPQMLLMDFKQNTKAQLEKEHTLLWHHGFKHVQLWPISDSDRGRVWYIASNSQLYVLDYSSSGPEITGFNKQKMFNHMLLNAYV